jgi:hypothetical protein
MKTFSKEACTLQNGVTKMSVEINGFLYILKKGTTDWRIISYIYIREGSK